MVIYSYILKKENKTKKEKVLFEYIFIYITNYTSVM